MICFIVSNQNGSMELKKTNILQMAYCRIPVNRRFSKRINSLITFQKSWLEETIDIPILCILNILYLRYKNCEKSFALMSCIFEKTIISFAMNETFLHFLFFHSHFFKGQLFLIYKFSYFDIIFIIILFFVFLSLL